MRLWSLHPSYLDARGLVALWRETLLAQAVLCGKPGGDTHHPQLERFRAQRDPAAAVAAYLVHVHAEAERRGYSFDGDKIGKRRQRTPVIVTRGQLEYVWRHLLAKLAVRDPARHASIRDLKRPRAHPCLRVVAGGVEPWERI